MTKKNMNSSHVQEETFAHLHSHIIVTKIMLHGYRIGGAGGQKVDVHWGCLKRRCAGAPCDHGTG